MRKVGWAPLVIACLIAAAGCGTTSQGGTSSSAARVVASRRTSDAPVRATRRGSIVDGLELDRRVDAAILAEAPYGQVNVAAWPVTQARPTLVGNTAGVSWRMWSMAKPVTAIALLAALARHHLTLDAAGQTAMADALRRSDNCGETWMILRLQQLDASAGAFADFAAVLSRAGVSLTDTPQTGGLATECGSYMQVRAPIDDATAIHWSFGTATWTLLGAVSFARALGAGVYGAAGQRVLELMSEPKEAQLTGLEGPSGDHIADPEWGAGEAFAGEDLAYKAGWGGSQERDFVAGQLGVVGRNARQMAFAIYFLPAIQPDSDDVGRTAAPAVIERVLSALRSPDG